MLHLLPQNIVDAVDVWPINDGNTMKRKLLLQVPCREVEIHLRYYITLGSMVTHNISLVVGLT